MDDPQVTWRLGRWIARRVSGTLTLTWSSGSITLAVIAGKVVAVHGIDPSEVALELGFGPIGYPELLAEARAVARHEGTGETQAVGAAKTVLQRRLRQWITDPERELEIDDAEPEAIDGPTVSLAHALVELLLADDDASLTHHVLPDLGVLLRRSPSFLELYAPLRLSEEADLIVAKITGQRTAVEIASRSPHGQEEVIRLLAALVVTGMLEPVPVASSTNEVDILERSPMLEEVTRRRLPIRWLLIAAAVLAVALVIGTLFTLRGRAAPAAPADGQWSLVVDMGCEPQELRRVLQKANQHPKDLQAMRASLDQSDPCWRLVWGRFPSEDAALAAIDRIPAGYARDGFTPHAIQISGAAGGES